MTDTCPNCGREYTSRQTWFQPNQVKYHLYNHSNAEPADACRVKAESLAN